MQIDVRNTPTTSESCIFQNSKAESGAKTPMSMTSSSELAGSSYRAVMPAQMAQDNGFSSTAMSGGRHKAHVWNEMAKRSLDVVVSLSALIILAPLLLIIAGLIRLESKGSPLFSQLRWGKDGKVIRIYKFRSMRSDLCDHTGVKQTIRNDPRITKLGAIIRRTNLDELPQLLNVLRGDMSLVGPRCHALGMLAGGVLYEDLVPDYHKRHVMRPGLTGLAQMRGLRGPTESAAKSRARIYSDIYYVQNFSFMLDIKILVGTVKSELSRGKGF